MMNYTEIEQALVQFADYDVTGSLEATRSLINRATRFVGNWLGGRWNHLHVYDYPITISSERYLALPSNFHHIDVLSMMTLQRGITKRFTEYKIEVTAPTTLVAAPTRRIKFDNDRVTGETWYLTYWRNVQEFAVNDVYPDIPNSGEAILEVARWMVIQNERTSAAVELKAHEERALAEIRKLWIVDSGYDIEDSAMIVDADTDRFVANTQFDLHNGSESSRGTFLIGNTEYGR